MPREQDHEVKTAPDDTGLGCVLQCPTCGGYNLHQFLVEVWDRPEDLTPIHARIEGNYVSVDHDNTGNPSPRRQGMTVDFECEACAEGRMEHTLEIVQHKGRTYMRWLLGERITRSTPP